MSGQISRGADSTRPLCGQTSWANRASTSTTACLYRTYETAAAATQVPRSAEKRKRPRRANGRTGCGAARRGLRLLGRVFVEGFLRFRAGLRCGAGRPVRAAGLRRLLAAGLLLVLRRRFGLTVRRGAPREAGLRLLALERVRSSPSSLLRVKTWTPCWHVNTWGLIYTTL